MVRMQAAKQRHVFVMLDVLRGLAALVVAERHLAYYFGQKQLPGSYLAVDIFFVLSGFVLAHAYEGRFAAGLRWPKFLVIRIIRLYPLYLVGGVLGFAAFLLGDGDVLPDGSLPYVMLCAALFLPLLVAWPAGTPSVALYPLNPPTWTLLFELLANVLHALLAPWLSNRVLHGIIAISAVCLIGATFYFGHLDVGYRLNDYWLGIPRVCFSYFLGVRLYRHWAAGVHLSPSILGVVLSFLVLVSLPVAKEYRVYYDMVAVLFLIPGLVYHAASVSLDVRFRRWVLPIGTASYGYYVLHVPFGLFCMAVTKRLGIDLTATAPWGGAAVLGVIFAVALVLDRYYDLPVRRWLLRRIRVTSA